MSRTPEGVDVREVMALLDRAWRGKWSVHDAGANDGGTHEYEVIVAGDGTSNFPQATTGVFYADPHDANAACAAVNYLRAHGAAVAELVEAAQDVLDGTVNATTYPDGPCIDRADRERLRAALSRMGAV